MDKDYIAQELKRHFRNEGITQQEIADQMGVSQAYIGRLLNGDRAIGKQTAEKLHNLYGFNRGWLLTGEGDMLVSGNTATAGNGSNQVVGNNTGHISQTTASDLTAAITDLTEIIKQSQTIATTAQNQLSTTLAQLTESQDQITALINLLNAQTRNNQQ